MLGQGLHRYKIPTQLNIYRRLWSLLPGVLLSDQKKKESDEQHILLALKFLLPRTAADMHISPPYQLHPISNTDPSRWQLEFLCSVYAPFDLVCIRFSLVMDMSPTHFFGDSHTKADRKWRHTDRLSSWRQLVKPVHVHTPNTALSTCRNIQSFKKQHTQTHTCTHTHLLQLGWHWLRN